MKKLFFLIPILLIACASLEKGKMPSVCDDPTINSEICAIANDRGVRIEGVYNVIFTSAATASAMDIVERTEVCAFTKEIYNWLMVTPIVSYRGILSKVLTMQKGIKNPEKAALIANIISSNLQEFFSSTMIVRTDDRNKVIVPGLQLFMSDMLCE